MVLKSNLLRLTVLIHIIFSIADNLSALTNQFPLKTNNSSFEVALPNVLRNVSEIKQFVKNTIACGQVVNRKYFVYNSAKKTSTKSYIFSTKDDFEEIAILRKILSERRSSWGFYEIVNFQSSQMGENVYTLNISSSVCEGICYDKPI